MTKIKSFDEIGELFSEIKSLHKKLITNFYPAKDRVSIWINKGLLTFDRVEDTVFFFKESTNFKALYYASTDLKALQKSLKELQVTDSDETFILDLVTNKDEDEHKALFFDCGFSEYTSLVRMSRLEPVNVDEQQAADVVIARQPETLQILELFHTYFDPLAEQTPLEEEITQWIGQERIIVYKDGDRVIGFIIYDLLGATLYLRYWFVHPEFRDRKIGSKLFNRFFAIGKDSKRQLFWVIKSNENAIKRYRHFGFKEEKLQNYILINKKNRYEQADS